MQLTGLSLNAFDAWKSYFESIGATVDQISYKSVNAHLLVTFLSGEVIKVYLQTKKKENFDPYFVNPESGESTIAVSFLYNSDQIKPLTKYTITERGMDHIFNCYKQSDVIAFGSFNQITNTIENPLLVKAKEFLEWFWLGGACIDRRYEDIQIKRNLFAARSASFVDLPIYHLERFAYLVPSIFDKSDGFKNYKSKVVFHITIPVIRLKKIEEG